jgi:putative RNA 2'-phosphotransferase
VNSRNVSMKLSHLLRHDAIGVGLAMDGAGWSRVTDVLTLLNLTESELTDAIVTNTKSRLERKGELVRACQGHSLEGTPVTLVALEASWEIDTTDDDLWHGTTADAAAMIRESGLQPIRRTHVHFARSEGARVGKRSNVDVVLRVSRQALKAANISVWRAPNDVLLVRSVPPACIVWPKGNSVTTTRA